MQSQFQVKKYYYYNTLWSEKYETSCREMFAQEIKVKFNKTLNEIHSLRNRTDPTKTH